MSHGSQQLRRFRIARRDGASLEDAAELAGMTTGEARLHANADDKNPPPPEAYLLIGHNKGPTMAEASDDRLRLLIERVERLEEEKQALADDIRDVYAEAKAVGYDTKIMREIVKLRKMEPDDRRERQALLDTYLSALGMDYAETPLGKATVDRALQRIEGSDTAMTITAGGVEYKNKAARRAARAEENDLRDRVGDVLEKAVAEINANGGNATLHRSH